jgi:hypothetical protein
MRTPHRGQLHHGQIDMSLPVIRIKDGGVSFARIAPGGFRILRALDETSTSFGIDLIITSACDGEHSGPDDPHHRGEAYDVRSHDFSQDLKLKVVETLQRILGPDFFVFLESPGTPNEHIHAQVKRGTVFPPGELNATQIS